MMRDSFTNTVRQAAGELRLAAYNLDRVCCAAEADKWEQASNLTDAAMLHMGQGWRLLSEMNPELAEVETA